jgi:hypothetical protein
MRDSHANEPRSTLCLIRDGGNIAKLPELLQVKANNGRPLLFIHYAGRRSIAKLLTRDAARRIAAGIARLPELLPGKT